LSITLKSSGFIDFIGNNLSLPLKYTNYKVNPDEFQELFQLFVAIFYYFEEKNKSFHYHLG
jgi:hypothetical protein